MPRLEHRMQAKPRTNFIRRRPENCSLVDMVPCLGLFGGICSNRWKPARRLHQKRQRRLHPPTNVECVLASVYCHGLGESSPSALPCVLSTVREDRQHRLAYRRCGAPAFERMSETWETVRNHKLDCNSVQRLWAGAGHLHHAKKAADSGLICP